ncbi:unnamed protein product, partial [Iphiclides podalirius]
MTKPISSAQNLATLTAQLVASIKSSCELVKGQAGLDIRPWAEGICARCRDSMAAFPALYVSAIAGGCAGAGVAGEIFATTHYLMLRATGSERLSKFAGGLKLTATRINFD